MLPKIKFVHNSFAAFVRLCVSAIVCLCVCAFVCWCACVFVQLCVCAFECLCVGVQIHFKAAQLLLFVSAAFLRKSEP